MITIKMNLVLFIVSNQSSTSIRDSLTESHLQIVNVNFSLWPKILTDHSTQKDKKNTMQLDISHFKQKNTK